MYLIWTRPYLYWISGISNIKSNGGFRTHNRYVRVAQKRYLYSRDLIECLTNRHIGSKNTEIIQVSSLRKSSYAFCSYKSKLGASTIPSKNL